MRFEQTRDILDHARRFHRRISDYYQRLSDHSKKQRLKMLLDYMSQRERELAEALQQFTEGSSREVLDTWFQFRHDDDILRLPSEARLHDDMSVGDVLRAGVALSQCFVNLFGEIASDADSEKVRTVFRSLQESEQREQKKLVRNTEMFMDM